MITFQNAANPTCWGSYQLQEKLPNLYWVSGLSKCFFSLNFGDICQVFPSNRINHWIGSSENNTLKFSFSKLAGGGIKSFKEIGESIGLKRALF